MKDLIDKMEKIIKDSKITLDEIKGANESFINIKLTMEKSMLEAHKVTPTLWIAYRNALLELIKKTDIEYEFKNNEQNKAH